MDIFYTDGALNWTAVSTVSTIVLTAALVIVTAWYSYLIHKRDNHDRLVKEMEQLVSPLYVKSRKVNKSDYFLSTLPYKLHNIPDGTAAYYRFWDEIQSSKHLGPKYLVDAINQYLEIINAHTESQVYKAAERYLISCIESRYVELSCQLSAKSLRSRILDITGSFRKK